MVTRQIAARGIRDPRLLETLRRVPRDRFIPEAPLRKAYGDHPVAIGDAQTISQPFMVAWMTELLAPTSDHRVLEIGTGSGYQTAVLADLAREVYTLETREGLARAARERLDQMGYRNIRTRTGDGSRGWPEEAPFDRILITAAAPEIPPPILEQLRDGGRMVLPVGGRWAQDLVLVTRKGRQLERKSQGGCVFVKLIGEYGFPPG